MISIGDGLAVAFKIESHNHRARSSRTRAPRRVSGASSVTSSRWAPARSPCSTPCASAIRARRARALVDGVVRGVGGYGNCVGVPTIGGELVFDESYQGNPLVNVMAIGLLEERRLTRAAAPGPGNLAVLFGSTTGRDGIGGASVLASATFSDDDPSKRPSVQVGDPFAEKLLIEASLELIERGLVEGLQDLGAGGITCATSETADRAGTGIRIDLDAVPARARPRAVRSADLRVAGADARDRAPRPVGIVREVCARWGCRLPSSAGDGRRRHRGRRGRQGDCPHACGGLTSDAIVHHRLAAPPAHRRGTTGRADRDQRPAAGAWHGPRRGPAGARRLAEPRLTTGRLRAVRLDGRRGHTVAGPGHGAAASARARHEQGARRDDRCQPGGRGPRPVARRRVERRRGHPQRLDHRRSSARRHELPELRRPHPARGVLAARGGGARARRRAGRSACRSRAATSRSTTNLRKGRSPDARDRRRGAARRHRDARRAGIRRRGRFDRPRGESGPGLAGSEYARLAGAAAEDDPPSLDLAREAALQAFVREAVARGLVASAQDVSGGGLAVALAECAIWSGSGPASGCRSPTRRLSRCSARAPRASC